MVTAGRIRRSPIRDPDWALFEEFQEAAGGRIVLVTLAPERSGAIDFIRRATGVRGCRSAGSYGRVRNRDSRGRRWPVRG